MAATKREKKKTRSMMNCINFAELTDNARVGDSSPYILTSRAWLACSRLYNYACNLVSTKVTSIAQVLSAFAMTLRSRTCAFRRYIIVTVGKWTRHSYPYVHVSVKLVWNSTVVMLLAHFYICHPIYGSGNCLQLAMPNVEYLPCYLLRIMQACFWKYTFLWCTYNFNQWM